MAGSTAVNRTSEFHRHAAVFTKCMPNHGRGPFSGPVLPPTLWRGPQAGPETVINGRRVVMMCLDDPLCLSRHKRVVQASIDAIRRYGTGCSGSRFLNGTLDIHQALESALAGFLKQSAAIVFPSGFQSMLGAISTLLGKHDLALIDSLAHPGFRAGCRLSFGRVTSFQHSDTEDLERKLDNSKAVHKLVIIDGVSGTLGDIADLPRITALCRHHSAGIVMNDTHAIGILGANCGGSTEHFSPRNKVDLIVAGFHGLGSSGGCLAGDADVIDYIKHHARSLIFSASLAPASAAALLSALRVMQNEPWRRNAAVRNAHRLRTGCTHLGFEVVPGITPIVALRLNSSSDVYAFWRKLMDRGVVTRPFPFEPASLRMTCRADHTDQHIDRVLEALHNAGKLSAIL